MPQCRTILIQSGIGAQGRRNHPCCAVVIVGFRLEKWRGGGGCRAYKLPDVPIIERHGSQYIVGWLKILFASGTGRVFFPPSFVRAIDDSGSHETVGCEQRRRERGVRKSEAELLNKGSMSLVWRYGRIRGIGIDADRDRPALECHRGGCGIHWQNETKKREMPTRIGGRNRC